VHRKLDLGYVHFQHLLGYYKELDNEQGVYFRPDVYVDYHADRSHAEYYINRRRECCATFNNLGKFD
jgi:hypothetical protein